MRQEQPRPWCLPCLRGFHDLCDGVYFLDDIEYHYNCECPCEQQEGI